MLVLKDISKSYYLENEKINALKNINLTINKGEFVAIIGQSGSGKSTLLNILGCLDRQSDGKYFLCGKNVSKLSSAALSKARSRKIGFVFQSFNLIENLTALENTELPLIYRGTPKNRRRKLALSALNAVGMGERTGHLPSQLSGGQMQRVAVARALICDPDIILADEPTGNLDFETGREVLAIFKNLTKKGKTVVMVTHDNKIANEADRIIRREKLTNRGFCDIIYSAFF